MELRHLRYFIAVPETGSLSRAAEKLAIAQPPLSVQIRQLEDAMDAPLFVRHPKGVRLTAAAVVHPGVAFRRIRRPVQQQALALLRRKGDARALPLLLDGAVQTIFERLSQRVTKALGPASSAASARR
jgi:DNA-binding transcriptional LysR family regulator